jgi:hypothetical protein
MSLQERVTNYIKELNAPLNGWGHHPEGRYFTQKILRRLYDEFGKDEVNNELDRQFAEAKTKIVTL